MNAIADSCLRGKVCNALLIENEPVFGDIVHKAKILEKSARQEKAHARQSPTVAQVVVPGAAFNWEQSCEGSQQATCAAAWHRRAGANGQADSHSQLSQLQSTVQSLQSAVERIAASLQVSLSGRPAADQTTQQQQRRCFVCGEKGHLARECPAGCVSRQATH